MFKTQTKRVRQNVLLYIICELVHPWQSITSCPGGGVVGIIICVVVSCFMWLAYDTPLSSEELLGKRPE